MTKFVKLLITAVIISIISSILLLTMTVDTETVDTLLNIRHEFLAIALGLQLFSYFIWGTRTKFMCQSMGTDIPLSRSVEIAISSLLVAAVTPSSAGGEPLRIHLLHNNDIPLGKATAVVAGERILDATLILIAAPIAFHMFLNIFEDMKLELIFIIGELCLLSFLLMFAYSIWKPHKIKALTHLLAERTKRFHGKKTEESMAYLLNRIDREIDTFHSGLYMLLKDGKAGLACGMFCTVIHRGAQYSILPVILAGLNQQPLIPLAFAAQILLVFIMIIPATPGASGVAEAGAISLFSVLLSSSSLVGITVIAWRAFTYYTNIVAGSFVSAKILKDTDFIQDLLESK